MEMMNNRTFFKAIEDDYIKSLPIQSFPGPICVVEDHDAFDEAEQSLVNVSLLGFDTETKPSFKKGRYHKVALLQLATEEKAFLFRLNKITLPRFVVDILENPEILKVGVALRDDLSALKKIMPMNPEGFVDLQLYVKQFGIEDNGLKKLVANILGFRISKRFQTSNWEQEFLSPEQLTYAATDAWVCRQIYHSLGNHSLSICM
jgi:ribonuclease D